MAPEALYRLWGQSLRATAIPNAFQAAIPDCQAFVRFIAPLAQAGGGVAVKLAGRLAGYMAYDAFRFHGEATAFCPIMAHAADPQFKLPVYQAMYRHLARRWVDEGSLNHIVTFFCADRQLQELLYDLGFGLYLVDAFRRTDLPVPSRPPIAIRASAADPSRRQPTLVTATADHAGDLAELLNEARQYYAEPPLFLVRHPEADEPWQRFIENGSAGVFMAYAGDQPVGLMVVAERSDVDPLDLSSSKLNAYIRQDYRGRGIGTALLSRCVEWSRRRGRKWLHVDWESANLYGNPFWRSHFTPMLYSVRRRLHGDILEVVRQDSI